jgi:hypothetical protein
MKVSLLRRCVILLVLLAPVAAQANPYILNEKSLLAFGVVAFWAFIVEAGVVALILLCRGLAPLRFFGAYFVANALVFFFVFQPLVGREWLPLVVLELIVVLIDAAVIKFLARFSSLQGEGFSRISWLYAITSSGIGNLLSFFVGYLISHKPWIYKSPVE